MQPASESKAPRQPYCQCRGRHKAQDTPRKPHKPFPKAKELSIASEFPCSKPCEEKQALPRVTRTFSNIWKIPRREIRPFPDELLEQQRIDKNRSHAQACVYTHQYQYCPRHRYSHIRALGTKCGASRNRKRIFAGKLRRVFISTVSLLVQLVRRRYRPVAHSGV